MKGHLLLSRSRIEIVRFLTLCMAGSSPDPLRANRQGHIGICSDRHFDWTHQSLSGQSQYAVVITATAAATACGLPSPGPYLVSPAAPSLACFAPLCLSRHQNNDNLHLTLLLVPLSSSPSTSSSRTCLAETRPLFSCLELQRTGNLTSDTSIPRSHLTPFPKQKLTAQNRKHVCLVRGP